MYQIGNRIDLYFLFNEKPMNNHFLDGKSTKTINNRNVIGLNRMGRLKHRIEIILGRSTTNFTEKICNQK